MLLRTKALPIDDDVQGPKLILTEAVVEAVDILLPKQVNGFDHENVLYIAGFTSERQHVGCTVIAPKALTGPGYYSTSRASHGAVLDFLDEHDLCVVAQVHCHPGYDTTHSDADDELAFVHAEGYWSLVVPYYGHSGMLPLEGCGIHRYSRGQFWLLSPEAAGKRVVIVPQYADLEASRCENAKRCRDILRLA